jgi:hypothetical protein
MTTYFRIRKYSGVLQAAVEAEPIKSLGTGKVVVKYTVFYGVEHGGLKSVEVLMTEETLLRLIHTGELVSAPAGAIVRELQERITRSPDQEAMAPKYIHYSLPDNTAGECPYCE